MKKKSVDNSISKEREREGEGREGERESEERTLLCVFCYVNGDADDMHAFDVRSLGCLLYLFVCLLCLLVCLFARLLYLRVCLFACTFAFNDRFIV